MPIESKASRVVFSGGVLFALYLLVIDPYTFHRTAGDFQVAPPFSQVVLFSADGLALLATAALVWKNARVASQILVCETLLSLSGTLVLLHRDGMARFIAGIGARAFLWQYILGVLVRVVLISWSFGVLQRRMVPPARSP